MKSLEAISRPVGLLLLAICPLLCGCGDGEEKASIEESWARVTQAQQDGDAKTYMSMLSPQSMKYWDNLTHLIRTAKADEVRRMDIADKATIVMVRNRCTKDELKKMDGKALLEIVMGRGWMGGDRGPDVGLGKIEVHGTSARAELVVGDIDTGIWMDFYKEDDTWKVDFTRGNEELNERMDRRARMFGQSIDDFILARERAFGKPPFPDVWDPPRL
jgi:hypothetical protein